MKRKLIITDLTRMQEGRVCVAGYDEKGECIRPVLPPLGIHENSLFDGERPVVFPFALVELDLLERVSHPPHTEDYKYRPGSMRLIKRVDDALKLKVLKHSLFHNVSSIFETTVFHDYSHYVLAGKGARSLGTISPKSVVTPEVSKEANGKWRYRLCFEDGEPPYYRLTITDLTWRYFHEFQLAKGNTIPQLMSYSNNVLKSSEIYLRIGLARGWAKFPDRCYLQVTGVCTFPDYLEGRTFADLKPH